MKVKIKLFVSIIFIIILISITNTAYGEIATDIYSIGANCIYDILSGTTVYDFKVNMKLEKDDKILDASNNNQADSAVIGSGMKLKMADGKEYTLSVKGDLSGEGTISLTDIQKLKSIIVGDTGGTDQEIYCMDVNDDNGLTSTDLINFKQYLVEIIDSVINAKKIVMPENISVEQGQEVNIEYKLIPITANKNLTWESSDKEIISVDENGKIKGNKMGEAVIKAKTLMDRFSVCNAICGIKPTGITLDSSEVTLSKEGSSSPKEHQIKVTITPETANIDNKITYSSSNTNVATVSETGLITAVGSGTARITATTANEKSAFVDVTVKTAIKDFTIGLSADGFSYDDYVRDNTIYIAYPNNSPKKWKDGSKKKPNQLQIIIRTDSGDTPTNVTYTSSNPNNLTASETGLITGTAKPSNEMVTTTRQGRAKLTINCEGIEKTYDVIIFCASGVLKRPNESGVACDYGGWQSGTTNKGAGHFMRCQTCGQCHRFHPAGVSVTPTSDSIHSVQCSICGGWVQPG